MWPAINLKYHVAVVKQIQFMSNHCLFQMPALKLCVAETTYQSEWRKISLSITMCRWSLCICPTNPVVLKEKSSMACRTICPGCPKTNIWLVEASCLWYNWNIIYLHPQYISFKGLLSVVNLKFSRMSRLFKPMTFCLAYGYKLWTSSCYE